MTPKNPVYWKEFSTGEFALRSTETSMTVAALEELAEQEISERGTKYPQWRRDEYGKLGVIGVGSGSALISTAEILNRISAATDGEPVQVQVIGYADARGAEGSNSSLSYFRAVAMKIILEKVRGTNESPQFQLCFAGENWQGAESDNAENIPWLRRVEIRYGQNRIDVTGCERPKLDGDKFADTSEK